MSFENVGERHAAALDLAEQTINDLVAAYPETMVMLAPLGIDLCCGGGHRLGEALDLHGLDRDEVLARVAEVVAAVVARNATA